MSTRQQRDYSAATLAATPYTKSFHAIGTNWRIDTGVPLSDTVMKAISEYIEYYDKTYSRFRADSLVTKIASEPGIYTFPNDVIPLISLYRTLYDITDGKVTPLIGEMLERAGYDTNYSFHSEAQTPLASWDAAMTWSDNAVTTTAPIVIDIGAAGKGHLIDLIGMILNKEGVGQYLIDASGDLIHKGVSEVIIGLEHPHDQSKVIGAVALQNASLCASASNRRSWGDGMHHIFDPQTMQPTRGIVATWAIADKAIIADGIATALFFTDPSTLMQTFKFEYARMHSDGSVEYSSKFEGAIYT